MEYDCGALPHAPPKGCALWNPVDFAFGGGGRARFGLHAAKRRENFAFEIAHDCREMPKKRTLTMAT
jgi:hypothetical protein